MNMSIVSRLILKDWYFQRRPIVLSLAGGVASLAVVAFGGKPGFTIGLVLLVTVMVTVSATLVMSTLVGERENQTLAFAMSLPISYLEYSAAKILANLLIFVPFWLILAGGSVGLILAAPVIHGLFAFTVIMAVEILVSTCLMIAVGLVTESKGWTISAMIVGNVGLNVVGYCVAHIPGIAEGMFGTAIRWSPAATICLVTEFAIIALVLGGAFYLQSRKTEFV
jgi:ABC-type transport system involved in multi-copper enzyme maturation permease subunit